MDLVLHAAILYIFVLVILRITGKRTLNEISTFDFVLLLLIAESTDNSIIGQDHALVSSMIVIITFVVLEIILSFFKQRFRLVDKWLEGSPVVLVENGKLLRHRAGKEKIDEGDILSAARKWHGLERMDQVKYAILEKNGGITIVPK